MMMYDPSGGEFKRDQFVHNVANKFINRFASESYNQTLELVYKSGMIVYGALLGIPGAVNELETLYLEAKNNVQE